MREKRVFGPVFLGLIVLSMLVHFYYNPQMSKSSHIYYGKNASLKPVWEEMATDSNARFVDICRAFELYENGPNYLEGADKHFREWKRNAEGRVREDGTIMSREEYEQRLLGYNLPLAFSQDNMICDTRLQEDMNEQASNGRSALTTSCRGLGSIYSGIANPNGAGEWTRVGPFGDPEVKWSATGNGRGMYIAVHPTDQKTIYLATSHGGLWRTRDAGATWTTLTDALPTRSTESIAIDPTNSKILYLGAGSGIYKSTDEGVSWTDISTGIDKRPFDIRINPHSTNVILANASNGIYRSADAGATWTKLLSGDFRNMDATDDWSVIVAVRENSTHQFFRSTDYGLTWDSTALTGYNTIVRPHLGLYKPHPDAADQKIYIYVMCEGVKNDDNPPSTKYAGLYKSDDLGVTFTEVINENYTYTTTPIGLKVSHPDSTNYSEIPDGYGELFGHYLGWFTNGFSINPKDPEHLLFPATKFWGSKNGGKSWVALPSYGGSNWADQHYSIWDLSGDTLLWVNDGGIWAMAYEDMWKEGHSQYVYSKNGDLAFSLSSQCDISTYNKNVHISGGQDIGQVFHRRGRDSHVASADVYRGRICPHNDSIFITGKLSVIVNTDTVSLYDFIEADYHNSRRIYGFTNSSTDPWLLRSPAGVDAWQFGDKTENKANAGGHSTTPVDEVRHYERLDFSSVGIDTIGTGGFEQSRANAELAFFGEPKTKQVFVTTDLSATQPTWTKLANAPASGRYRLATHPDNEDLLFLGTSQDVFVSRDGGESFEELGSFPDLNPIKILVDKRKSEGVYVLTERTVYYIDKTLENWIEFNRGLPLTGYNDMRIFWSEDGDNRLYVSNYGRGVLSSPLYFTGEKAPLIADFDIHGTSNREISVDESVQLFDLSQGVITNRSWNLTNGSETVTAGNELTPIVTFDTKGLYEVTLRVEDGSGVSNTRTRKGFITVYDTIKAVDCVPDSAIGAWYKGIGKVVLNGKEYATGGTGSGKYYDYTDSKSFTIVKEDEQALEIFSSYNDFTSYACKVYLDMDNSGSLEEDEVLFASNGREADEYSFTFTVSPETVVEQPIRLRVMYHEGTTIDDACFSASGEVEDYAVIVKNAPPSIDLAISGAGKDLFNGSATVTNGGTVLESGFVYSVTNPMPDITAAGRTVETSIITGDGTIAETITGLQRNATYTVRAYVVNTTGIFYSAPQTIALAPFVMPLLESTTPVYNSDDGSWTIGGRINPEGNSLEEISIQYGDGDALTTEVAFDPSTIAVSGWSAIDTSLSELPPFSSIYYRVKAVVEGVTYYSSIKRFNSEKDLYAYWNFDATSGNIVYDISGNSRHGVLNGATIVTGKFDGSGVAFDSENDVVTLGLPDLEPPFTVSFWAKRTADHPTSYASIFSGESGRYRVEMETWNTTRKVGIANNGNYDVNSGYVAPIDEWHHYTFIATSDTVTMYLNGVEQAVWGKQFKMPLTAMGKSGRSMIGLLDEVKVYSRALNPNELLDIEKQQQSISFDAIEDKYNSDDEFTLSATASSGLAVTFSVDNGADLVSLSGNTIYLTGDTGSVTIRAEQAGNSEYLASWTTRSFKILEDKSTSIFNALKERELPLSLYPNPVRSQDEAVKIQFVKEDIRDVELVILDQVGNKVYRSVKSVNGDSFSAEWGLKNSLGRDVASGSYAVIVRATLGDGSLALGNAMIGVQR